MSLCGFYGLEEDERLGYTASEWAQSIFLPGANLYYGIRDLTKAPDAAPARSFSSSDYTKTAAYAQAQSALAAAQASAQASQSALAAAKSALRPAVIPVSVPSFSLPGTSAFAPMPPSIPDPPTQLPDASSPDTASGNPYAATIQGDSSMQDAAAHVEAIVKQHGLHASIAPSGAASCPNCGMPIHVVLREGPAVDPGSPAGTVQVVGGAVSAIVTKAASPGTCACSCPGCGVPICLSLTADGYTGIKEATPMNGYHIMGAASAPRRSPTRPAVRKGVVKGRSPHKESIVRAGNAVAKAMKAGAHATARAKQYEASKHKPVVPLQAVHGFGEDPGAVYVHGDDGRGRHVDECIDVFGCMFGASTQKPLTPTQKAAVQKHAQAVVRHAAAVKHAAAAGARATAAAKDLDAHRKKYAPAIAKFINRQSASIGPFKAGPAGHVQVLGSDITVFGLDQYGNPRGAPGYDPSTEDGTGAGGGAGAGASGGTPLYTDVNGANPDPNLVPLPVRGQPLSASDAQAQYTNVPEDGIKYDGSQGVPEQSVGSYRLMYVEPWVNEQSGHGYVWHANPGEQPTWWRIENGHGDHGSEASMSDDQILSYSNRLGYGPLVGNPNGPLAGLRWATVDKQWFWASDNAPTWATAQADALIALTNKKMLEADNAAIAADNARIAQEQAQQAEDQAKQDAANALAQSAADTQAGIQAQAQAAQQAQADLQQQVAEQQQAAAQAAIEAQAQQVDLQAAQAQAQMDARARALQLDYIQQHPEVLEQQDQGGGYEQDDGGGGADPFAADGRSFNDNSAAFVDDSAVAADGFSDQA